MRADHGADGTRLVYVPSVPDGPDRPWTRGRLTRWWLVVPADLVAAVLVAFFVAAASHDLSQAFGLIMQSAGATPLAVAVARGGRRQRHHPEVLWPQGSIVVGVTWGACVIARGSTGAGGLVSFSMMLLAFLLAFQTGWRCLYGFAKAHDSLVPTPVQRRLDAQAQGASGDPD